MDKNEAIKIIRSNFPSGRTMLCEALKTLIPELCESEDEKIRKALKSFFDSEISDYGNVEWRKGIKYGEVVAWIEKQGERKSAEWSDEDLAMIDSIIADMNLAHKSTIGQEKWLKSLRLQKHWKPSKKQMGTLEQWLKENQYNGNVRYCYPIFESLYDDLKDINEQHSLKERMKGETI